MCGISFDLKCGIEYAALLQKWLRLEQLSRGEMFYGDATKAWRWAKSGRFAIFGSRRKIFDRCF